MSFITEVFDGTAGSGDGNDTSLTHQHKSLHQYVFVQVYGTWDGATVTPYVDLTTAQGTVTNEIALPGISWTADTAQKVDMPHGGSIRLKITGSGASTELKASIVSPQAN